jgi:uncharacterized membrane protein YedE/YeeE
MTDFDPILPLIGGLLVGLAASMMLLTHGRVLGVSGLVGGLLQRPGSDFGMRLSFLGGMLSAGVIFAFLRPELFPSGPFTPLWVTAIAGFVVGFGTRLGNGCTSGHGVCGISRLSTRSLVATGTFMATGIATVFLVRTFLAPGSN